MRGGSASECFIAKVFSLSEWITTFSQTGPMMPSGLPTKADALNKHFDLVKIEKKSTVEKSHLELP